jgi:hypothetical protein
MRIDKSDPALPHSKNTNTQASKSGLKMAKGVIKTAAKVAVPFGPPSVSLSLSAAAKLLGSQNSDENSTAPIEAEKSEKKQDDIKKTMTYEKPKDLKKEEKLEKIKEVKKVNLQKTKGTSKKPGVFFIGGFQLFSSSLLGDGVKDMSNAMKGAEYFDWDQKSDILEEISKRHPSTPIVLVGHSLGGDTAVEIANELNSLENQFRKVDLLVTLDSFGFNNDIISQNVEKNLNFISDEKSFLNDGPNIARNNDMSNVINELRNEGHTGLDDSEEIQLKIFDAISDVITETA